MTKRQKNKMKRFVVIQVVIYSIIIWILFSLMEGFWLPAFLSLTAIFIYTASVGKLLRKNKSVKTSNSKPTVDPMPVYEERYSQSFTKPVNHLDYVPKSERNSEQQNNKEEKNESEWQIHRQRVKDLIEESQKKHVQDKHEKLEKEVQMYRQEPTTEPEKENSAIVKTERIEPEDKKAEIRKTDVHQPIPITTREAKKEKKVPCFSEIETKSFFEKPSISFLNLPARNRIKENRNALNDQALLLEETLESFGVKAKVLNVTQGPAITRYELQPERGVKVSKVTNLSDDIALNMAARSIRIEAPIPGKAAIGIEIPNGETSLVTFRELIESRKYQQSEASLPFAMGKNIGGDSVIFDLTRAPHLLIAGATGSGKSVCINTLILSLLFNARPDRVKLLLIDPKVVELNRYNGIPHLITPVITDPKKATASLKWAVREMEERYQIFAEAGVRDLEGYQRQNSGNQMPYMVIIIDELADLMMVAAKEVEDNICRLAQKARAAGIHLVLATQRPSVDVITGLIKANIPSRIAFSVASQVDSRTILDMSGAEKLLGRGDMLFHPVGASKPVRIQGAFLSDEEVQRTVEYLERYQTDTTIGRFLEAEIEKGEEQMCEEENGESEDVFQEALRIAFEHQQISISMLQRKLRMGFNRAARLIDEMEERGYIGPSEGTKPRKVISMIDSSINDKQ
ncbi:MAG: DNA translocase FtsK [Tindallia sp. MSAO_Bac2]|nr:MAG: DNA translocase FtsK [Tindallia sp. MSAO_Bac2]